MALSLPTSPTCAKTALATPPKEALPHVLRKRQFRHLQDAGPFYFCSPVSRMNLYTRSERLCLVNWSVLAGAHMRSGEVSFAVRVVDLAELIVDWEHRAVGVRMRDAPYEARDDYGVYADMPVDLLLFAGSREVLRMLMDALAGVYGARTGRSLQVRARGATEVFSKTLTLHPEGRRVQLATPLMSSDSSAFTTPPPPRRLSLQAAPQTSSLPAIRATEWVQPARASGTKRSWLRRYLPAIIVPHQHGNDDGTWSPADSADLSRELSEDTPQLLGVVPASAAPRASTPTCPTSFGSLVIPVSPNSPLGTAPQTAAASTTRGDHG